MQTNMTLGRLITTLQRVLAGPVHLVLHQAVLLGVEGAVGEGQLVVGGGGHLPAQAAGRLYVSITLEQASLLLDLKSITQG